MASAKRIDMIIILPLVLTAVFFFSPAFNQLPHNSQDNFPTAIGEIKTPDNYVRMNAELGSFGSWLRSLPLKDKDAKIHLYDGSRKFLQTAHYAVLDMDIGDKNLQQCADAVIRLRSEYLYYKGFADRINFCFTSGDTASFRNWIMGWRPIVNGNLVSWSKTASVDSSYQTFRKYLDVVFTYAGSYSLSRQLKHKENANDAEIGDVFIQGGFPGHAVIIVDMAQNQESGEKVFLLAQSYMPAQDIHVLKNFENDDLNPWYKVNFGNALLTPEWVFTKNDLYSF